MIWISKVLPVSITDGHNSNAMCYPFLDKCLFFPLNLHCYLTFAFYSAGCSSYDASPYTMLYRNM